jgi:thioredoxin 2
VRSLPDGQPGARQARAERAGRVKLVDVDKAPALSLWFDVQAILTMLLIREGNVVARQTGAPQAAALRQWFDGALAKGPL